MPRRSKALAGAGLPSIWQGGDWRVLAAQPTKDVNLLRGLPDWPVGAEVPPEQWEPTGLTNWKVPIFDQGRTGKCVGCQWATGFRYAWQLSGQPDLPFSCEWVYAWINQGRDQGSQIGWGYRAIMDHGIALSGTIQDGDLPPDRIWFPQDVQSLAQVQTKAKRFRLGSAYKLQDVRQIGSALSRRFIVISGILVDSQFGKLDAEGVSPLPSKNDPNSGGHAVCLVDLKHSAKHGWCYRFHNSWGQRWGQNGFSWITDKHFTQSGWPFDCYAIQAVSDDPGDQASDPPNVAA